jgi:hypothetical protein
MTVPHTGSWLTGVAALTLAVVGCQAPEPSDVTPEIARAEGEAFRAKHEADYRRDWVTIAGLHFIEPGSYTAGSDVSNDIVLTDGAPPRLGRFTLSGEEVRFEPDADAAVRLGDQPLTHAAVLRDDGNPSADILQAGSVRVAVHRSGERKSLRVWDPEGPLARGFAGFEWFDIDPRHRVVGRFTPDPAPRTVKVVNTFGDLDEFQTEGTVAFELYGQRLTLRPFTTRPGRLYFVFKDASSGVETYDAARFLYADLRADGTAVIDFNQAYNPPCAFNPHTTCPIPLPENRLPVKVLAGERAYRGPSPH